MIDVLYVVEAAAACAWYRCRTPGEALHQRGYRVKVTMEPTAHEIDTARLVIFERPQWPSNLELFRRRKGKPVAVEIDDDLWHIDPKNPAHKFWGPTELVILEECVRGADFVTVTTAALADTVRVMNRNVKVLPNMLPQTAWPAVPERSGRDIVTIGWAGSPTHYNDLAILRGLINNVLDRYPEAELAISGMYQMPFHRHEHVRPVPHVSLEEYPSLLGTFDIGIAPVADTRFNRAKSDLKALEYAMCGVPVIASAGTYDSLPRSAGFLCKTPADWLRALSRLIERPDLRESMGAAARTWAESRTIERNIDLWVKAYGLEVAA